MCEREKETKIVKKLYLEYLHSCSPQACEFFFKSTIRTVWGWTTFHQFFLEKNSINFGGFYELLNAFLMKILEHVHRFLFNFFLFFFQFDWCLLSFFENCIRIKSENVIFQIFLWVDLRHAYLTVEKLD